MKGSKGIGIKLYMLIIFAIIFIVGISSFTWNRFQSFDEKNKKRLETTIQYTTLVDDARMVQVNFKVQVQEWKNTLLRGYDGEAFNKYYGQFTKENENVNAKILKVKDDMIKQGMDTSLVDSLLKEHEDLYNKYSNAIKSFDHKNVESFKIVDNLVSGIDRKTTENMDNLVKTVEDKVKLGTENMIKEAELDRSSFNKSIVYISVCGIALIIVFAILITVTYRGITRFINQFNKLIESAESGDLRVHGEVFSNDELGNITNKFNTFMDTIRSLISEVKNTSEVIVTSSNKISEASEELSKSAEEVSTSLSNVADASAEQSNLIRRSNDSVKGVTDGLHRITETTVYINNLGTKAMDAVIKGTENLKNQSEKMVATKNASENVTKVTDELSTKSKEIGKVVEFINSITEQINLLALNASIEAARAGEAGRGFVVVADEVKKLASLSKESTEKIDKLIIEVQSDVSKAVEEVMNTTSSIDEQEASLKTIDESFNIIKESVFEVVNKIEEVAKETNEINEDAIVVEGAMENIIDIIEQNAQSAEEISAATEEQTASTGEVASSMSNLSELSNKLQGFIDKFKV